MMGEMREHSILTMFPEGPWSWMEEVAEIIRLCTSCDSVSRPVDRWYDLHKAGG